MTMGSEKEVGKVTHYFNKIGVGIIELSDDIRVGDRLHIKGKGTDFSQNVVSMQIEHVNVESAGPGKSIGMKVDQEVRKGDAVYKVLD